MHNESNPLHHRRLSGSTTYKQSGGSKFSSNQILMQSKLNVASLALPPDTILVNWNKANNQKTHIQTTDVN